ncbi:MAG: septum formation initiator family protein [Acidobacteria bacterium]|nr:septum formation initiator family protein [Acidobacteriota bacterium]
MNNGAWLLRSSTLWGVLVCSGLLSAAILWISPDGFPSLGRRRAELRQYRNELIEKSRRNREILEEVRKLARQDPDLMEALARRQGFARPGETVFTFRDRGEAR